MNTTPTVPATVTSAPSTDVLTAPVGTPTLTHENVTKVRASKRRKYGTGLLVKRVVILNGEKVGRGKPAKGTLQKRTFVYIPVDAEYDSKVYGVGSRFAGSSAAVKPIKTVDRSKFATAYPLAVLPAKETEVKPKSSKLKAKSKATQSAVAVPAEAVLA